MDEVREIERRLRELARIADKAGAPRDLTLPERFSWLLDSVSRYEREVTSGRRPEHQVGERPDQGIEAVGRVP